MFQTLPFEILENITFYLKCQDLYSLSKVDKRVSEILSKRDYWLVKLPKTIDWSSPDAPKKYIPYDATDFIIYYKNYVFRRSQGVSFSPHKIKGRRCLVSIHPNPVILYKDSLVVDTKIPFLKDKQVKYQDIVHILSNWVTRGRDSDEKGEKGLVGVKHRVKRIDPENRWRSIENNYNIRIRGKKYESDFSLEFETDPKFHEYLENDE